MSLLVKGIRTIDLFFFFLNTAQTWQHIDQKYINFKNYNELQNLIKLKKYIYHYHIRNRVNRRRRSLRSLQWPWRVDSSTVGSFRRGASPAGWSRCAPWASWRACPTSQLWTTEARCYPVESDLKHLQVFHKCFWKNCY